MAISLTQLRSFLAVMRSGSVTAAADELVVTQPSVSAAVSALSRELGVALTERVGRSVRPTEAGSAFTPYAADVIGLLEQGARAAREAADAASAELRIVAVTTAGEYIVPPVLEAFAAHRPEARLSVEVTNRRRLLDRLHAHSSDVGIGGRPPPDDGGVTGERFLENPIVLITAPDDRLTERHRVPLDCLAKRPWLLREEGSGTRAMTEEFLAGHGLRPPVLTLGSNGAIKQAVRAGLGVALQSRLAVELELSLGLLATIDLREPHPPRHWYVLRPARGPVRPLVADFVDFVRAPAARVAVERAAALSSEVRAGRPADPQPPRRSPRR
jgi:LysR family transcriptional regulator, low CO2-responsive transcriptional regulator